MSFSSSIFGRFFENLLHGDMYFRPNSSPSSIVSGKLTPNVSGSMIANPDAIKLKIPKVTKAAVKSSLAMNGAVRAPIRAAREPKPIPTCFRRKNLLHLEFFDYGMNIFLNTIIHIKYF